MRALQQQIRTSTRVTHPSLPPRPPLSFSLMKFVAHVCGNRVLRFFCFLFWSAQVSLDILIISLGGEYSNATSPTFSGEDISSSTTTTTTAAEATPSRTPNKFVLQNVAKFQRLLGPSLRADTPGIRQRLLRLIQHLAALYGPGRPPKEFQEANFWDNFQVHASDCEIP